MLDKKFSFKIALFNFAGYCTGTLTATLVDPYLDSHVVYGARQPYKYAWVWICLSLLVFIITYYLLYRSKSKLQALVGAVSPLIIIGCSASLGFPPERPHMGILGSTFGFALLSFITTWLRLSHRALDSSDAITPVEARLEYIKAIITTWQQIAIYGAVGYLAFVISWAYVVSTIVQLTVRSDRDKYILGEAGIIQILVISVCVIMGPLYDSFKYTFSAVDQLPAISSKGNQS